MRELGSRTVGSTTGTAYQVSLPVAALSALVSSNTSGVPATRLSQLRAGLDQLSRSGVTTLTAQLVLDSAGRPVQLTTTTPPVGGSPATRLTASFSGWGAPVSVTAPPAAQVRTLDRAQLAALAPSEPAAAPTA